MTHLFPLEIVQRAAHLVDASGVASKLCEWMKADQKHRGGKTSPSAPGPRSLRGSASLWHATRST